MLLVRTLLVLLVLGKSPRCSTSAQLMQPIMDTEITTTNKPGSSVTDPTQPNVTMTKITASNGDETSDVTQDTTTTEMKRTSDTGSGTSRQTNSSSDSRRSIMAPNQQEPSTATAAFDLTSAPMTPPDRKLSAFDTASNFFPGFPSQVVASESEYCGQTCGFTYPHTRIPERPACDKCRCDEECVLYDDCCPDYLILRNKTSEAAPYSCENTSPDMEIYATNWYYMIRSCTVTSNPGLVQECLDRHSTHWEHQVPVADAKTGHLYRNKFCALCNNVTVFNNWETQLKCESYPSSLKEAKSPEDIYNIAVESRTCAVKFLPTGGNVLRSCSYRQDGFISSCNVTGQWEDYGRRLVEACERFTHVVDGKYRNVFCYVCNTHLEWREILQREGFLPWIVDGVGLTSLLDFSDHAVEQIHGIVHMKMDVCGKNQFYDNVTEACRNVTCSTGKVFNGTACNDVVQATNIYGLEICLHVRVDVPSRLVSREAVEDLTFTISKMLYGVQRELSEYVWLRTSQQLFHLQNCESHPRFLIVHIHTQMFSSIPASLQNLMTSLPDILTKHISDERNGNISLTWNQKCAQMIPPTLNCFDEVIDDKRMDFAPLSHADAYISSRTEYIPWNNQALCPQVHLQPHEFVLELDGDKQHVTNVLFPNVSLHSPIPLTTVDPYVQEFYVLRINGTDSIFKSEMFLLGDNETAVVCLDDYQKIVKKVPVVTNEYIDLPLGRTSLICTCLSLVFLIITFVFYCAFPTLRTSGGVINMCLIVTLFLTLCVYEFGMEQNENETVCVIIGIFIHFFWLSVLCWMNACTTHMFLKLSFPLRWRRNESLERTLLFWSLFSILTPAAIVSINIIVHYTLDRKFGYGGKVCYLNTVPGRIYSFGVPVAVVSLINIFLFIFTLCKLKRKFEPVQKSSNSKLNLVACVKLSTITGISWLFGYIYELTQIRVLAYVFTILVAGQGVFLFLAFIVNKKTLGLVCSKNRGSSKYTSSSNSSNNNNSKSGPPTTQISRL